MKKFFQRTSLLLATAFIGAATLQAQKSPQDMDRFIDALIKRMTVEEKIGQLNLPVTGEITTGQAKSSDVAKKIEQGLVGGLFNLKGVAKIRDVQKLAVENSRLGIPLLFGMDVIHGYETIFPIPLGLSCTWDMAAIQESARIAAVEASADGISWTVRWWTSAATRVGDVSAKVAVKTPSSAERLPKRWSTVIREPTSPTNSGAMTKSLPASSTSPSMERVRQAVTTIR